MNIRVIIIWLVLLCSLPVFGQVKIEGIIKNSKGELFSGVSVTLLSLPDSAMVAYSFSNDHGEYSITYKGINDNLLLSVKAMVIKSQSRKVARISQVVDFTIEEASLFLQEIKVQASRVWGQKDTINYLVSSFSTKTDLVIGDILKKLPGISVHESGSISYQGKAINKFYVENLDLLGGRYGIATSNISAEDVSTIQVLENHQPIKALEEIELSTDAALNIKLKEKAKGTLSIMALLSAGVSPFLWETELSALYFQRKQQHVSTYKSNNSGVDLSKEQQSFTQRNEFGLDNVLGLVIPVPPAINQERYLFNNSNSATINNLFKTKDEAQINVNILYLNDHERRDSYDRTSFFMGDDSILVVDEDLHSALNIDRIQGEFRYHKNTKEYYINNNFHFQGEWTNRLGFVSAENNIEQRIKTPVLSFLNKFHLIKRKENAKGIEFNSSIGFKSTPQSFYLTPGLYEEIFNEGNPYSRLKQNAKITHLFLNNKFSVLSPWVIGNVVLSPSIVANFNRKTLSSSLSTLTNFTTHNVLIADSLRNDLNQINLEITPSLGVRYHYKSLKLFIDLPLSYHLINVDNKRMRSDKNSHEIYFQPSININYDLNSEVSFNLTSGMYTALGDINTLYNGYILENYRKLNRYDNRLLKLKGQYVNTRINYKNVLNMLFISINLNYNYVKRNVLYAQQFRDILSVTSSIDQDNSSNNTTLRGLISKGFVFMNTTLSLDGSYGVSDSEQLRQNQLIKYKNNRINLKGTVHIQPISWLVLDYEGVWNRSWSRMKNESSFKPIRIFKNTVTAEIFLPKEISLKANYEHYYNSAGLNNRYSSFTDLAVNYTWQKINFSLTWNNIFDKDKHVTAYYNSINAYQHSYHIRGSTVMVKVRMKLF